MDERVKHRIIGLAVIFALIIMFAPVLIKRSNYQNNKRGHTSFKIPTAPPKPQFLVEEDETFKPMKVAHISLDKPQPSVAKVPKSILVQQPTSTAQSRTKPQPTKPSIAVTKPTMTKPAAPALVTAKKVSKSPVKVSAKAPTPKHSTGKNVAFKPQYAIQLASFSNPKYAKGLVQKLKKQGYAAYYQVKKNTKGQKIVRVMVAPKKKTEKAKQLLAELRHNMHLNGIIVRRNIA